MPATLGTRVWLTICHRNPNNDCVLMELVSVYGQGVIHDVKF